MTSSGLCFGADHQMTRSPSATSHLSLKSDKKKKSIIPKIFGKRDGRGDENEEAAPGFERRTVSERHALVDASPLRRKVFSERLKSSRIEGFTLSNLEPAMKEMAEIQDIRIFAGTWNVGGRSPTNDLSLEEFLQVEGSSDIYVVGFQEIVPLNAGNVLVIEDNEPAAKWLTLISQALNRPNDPFRDDPTKTTTTTSSESNHSSKYSVKSQSGLLFFQKPSLKVLSRNLRVDNGPLKACNCNVESMSQWRRKREMDQLNFEEEMYLNEFQSPQHLSYCLIASKQMVGIFLCVWARSELVPHIAHLRVSCIGRGIMGCLGNKGCISVSMSLHHTSFCFICSHLASGEKEGDELRRNSDVAEIFKNTQFLKICKHPSPKVPEKILDHDRIIWLGDLNYRIALSYAGTRLLLEDHDWDALLQRDQLIMEREEGRVFAGWHEGRICFAPTYKYSYNSDSYVGETVKSKNKRRTPAWCDRILWYGNGMEQLSYIRGESRFSDHRPVCAVFTTEVKMINNNNNNNNRGRKETRVHDERIPKRHNFYEF